MDDETGFRVNRLRRPSLAQRPAAICAGPGQIVVYANPGFIESFGPVSIGLPASEGILGLDRAAFDLLDAVYRTGRPLGRWVERDGAPWRMTASPRLDPETRRIVGVAFNLRERSDLPLPPTGPPAR